MLRLREVEGATYEEELIIDPIEEGGVGMLESTGISEREGEEARIYFH